MNARRLWLGLGAVALAAALPATDVPVEWAGVSTALGWFIAAAGLSVAVGDGGLPSLAQGAFVGASAYTSAALRASQGWDPATAAIAGIGVAAVAGWLVARAVARLTSPFVVLATWLAAWSFAMVVQAFPRLLGAGAGISLGAARFRSDAFGRTVTLGPVAWFELSLAAAVFTAVAVVGVRARFGPALALARHDPAAAIAAGVPIARLRSGALVFSAVCGGVAGVLLVGGAGVADPRRYGPILSVKLLAVVLVGGATTLTGPAAGLGVLAVIDRISDALARAFDPSAPAFEPLVAGIVLLVLLLLARDGVIHAVRTRRRPTSTAGENSTAPANDPDRIRFVGGRVEAHAVSVRFGGIDALMGVDLRVEPGTCHAVIGPNGSGKSTLLRVLSGTTAATAGWAPADPGVARVLQRLDDAPDLSARDAVVAGMEPARATGWIQACLQTPRHRMEVRSCARAADFELRSVQLVGDPATALGMCSAGDRRLVQIARAVARRPHALLLDEPSAGMDAAEERRLVAVLAGLRAAGLTMVIVEHNVGLVAELASVVTVLAAGTVVARGAPSDVVRDPVVQSVYLGEMAGRA